MCLAGESAAIAFAFPHNNAVLPALGLQEHFTSFDLMNFGGSTMPFDSPKNSTKNSEFFDRKST
jgi:hypothetical protein